MRTFFTVPADYDIQKSGSSTIAAGGLAIYSARANGIPAGRIPSAAGHDDGRVYRVKLSEDGRSAVGENEELFRTANRYRDIAIGPDQHTFYLVTDNNGLGPNDGSVWREGHDLCQSRIRARGEAQLVTAAQQEDHKEQCRRHAHRPQQDVSDCSLFLVHHASLLARMSKEMPIGY
jgi:hypothetical protein